MLNPVGGSLSNASFQPFLNVVVVWRLVIRVTYFGGKTEFIVGWKCLFAMSSEAQREPST